MLVLVINYWVQLKADFRRNPAASRMTKAFLKISSEPEMKDELNAARRLIWDDTGPLFAWVSDSVSRLLEIAICRRRIRSHSHWFCPVPVGEGVCVSLMEHFRPRLEAAGIYSYSHAHCWVNGASHAEILTHRLKVLNSLLLLHWGSWEMPLYLFLTA